MLGTLTRYPPPPPPFTDGFRKQVFETFPIGFMIKVPNIWRQFDRFQIFQCLPKDQISQWKTLSATKVETLACCCFHLSAAHWSSGTKSPEMRQGCRRDREEMEVYKYHRCQIWEKSLVLFWEHLLRFSVELFETKAVCKLFTDGKPMPVPVVACWCLK